MPRNAVACATFRAFKTSGGCNEKPSSRTYAMDKLKDFI